MTASVRNLWPATATQPAAWWVPASLVAAAVAARLLLTAVSRDIVDVLNYGRVADTLLALGPAGLYAHTPDIYPYPPPWALVEVAARWLSLHGLGSFSALVRLPGIAADAAITFLLWHWLRRRQPRAAVWVSLAYALNPVSLIITCLHGQFDAVPAALSLLAVYWATERPRPALSALSLGAAIAFKLYPLLLLPPLLLALDNQRARVRYTVLALTPVMVLLLPFFVMSPAAVMRELLGYRGVALLGFMVPLRTVYVPLTGRHFPVDTTLTLLRASSYGFLLAYGALLLWLRRARLDAAAACGAVLALFYFVYGGLSPQYLVWLLPFSLLAAARQPRLHTAHMLLGAAALLGFYGYAIPELFAFAWPLPARASQVFYGVAGTAWWLASGAVLAALGRPRPDEPVQP